MSASTLCASQCFVRPEEIPIRTAQQRPQNDQRHPQLQEPELESDVREPALLDRVVAVALLVEVDVRNRHQADDDQARQHDARHPRIVVHEHFLQTRGSTTGPSTDSASSRCWPALRAAPAARSPRRSGPPRARSCRSFRCRPDRATRALFRRRAFRAAARPLPCGASFSTALYVASHVKNASRNTSATIGTLSGLATIAKKFGSGIESARNSSIKFQIVQATAGFTNHDRNTNRTTSTRRRAERVDHGARCLR